VASAWHLLTAATAQDHAWINAEEQRDSGYNDQADDTNAAATLAHRDLEPAASSAWKGKTATATFVIRTAFVAAVFHVLALTATLPSHGNASLFHRKCARGYERELSYEPVSSKTPSPRSHNTRGHAPCPALHKRDRPLDPRTAEAWRAF
jgi:hypothetical protein